MSDREIYIPLSKTEVVNLVKQTLPATQREAFSAFVKILFAWYHYNYHAQLENLKESFHAVSTSSTTNTSASHEQFEFFEQELDRVVCAANFTPISEADLNKALAEESVFKVRLFVDFNDFDKVIFYRRGKSLRNITLSRWFGLSSQTIEFTNYDRVLIYVRFKTREQTHQNGRVILKLFENIPQADLEMLFPNTVVRMRLSDKVFIGVPAFLSGLIILTTKIGASLLLVGGLIAFWLGFRNEATTLDQPTLLALLSSAFALGAYLFKQFSNFKNRKIRFMKVLAENLYFKNLDNNSGVLANIIDYAEESECKEVLLGYGELLCGGPMSADQLLAAINTRLGNRTNFDIDGAIEKLLDLELCKLDNKLYHAKPLPEAIRDLDRRWDQIFSY